MNKTHRIVWSAVRQAYIVAHEHATACGKPASTCTAAVLVAGLLAGAPVLADTCVNLAGTTTQNPGMQCSILETGQSLKVSDDNAIDIEYSASGLLENAGTIEGAGGGLGAIHVHGAALDGLRNQASGSITGTNGVGLLVHSSGSIAGVANFGVIQGTDGHGISVDGGSTLGVFSGSQDGVAFLNTAGAQVVGGSNSSGSSALQISNGSTVNGDIVNEGSMTGGAYGLNIQNSTVNGDIQNSKILDGGDVGLYVKNSTVNGNIVNSASGEISGGRVGVHLDGVMLNGMIDNSGVIKGGVLADLGGLLVTGSSTLNGVNGVAIRNSGTITSGSSHALKIFGNPLAPEPDFYAFSVNNGGLVINGDIVNDTGGVLQSGSWDKAALVVENAVINGSIVNRGMIGVGDIAEISPIAVEVRAGSTLDGFVNERGGVIHGGVSVAGVVGVGGMLNTGLINTRVSGLELVDGGKADGAIRNEGTIAGDRGGYDYLWAQGILVDGSEAAGGVQNSGTISGVRDGLVLSNAAVSKGVLNDGQITLSTTESYGEGHGINIGSTESVGEGSEKEGKTHIVGDVVNSGSIFAGDMAVLDTERDVDGIHVEAARITGNLINSGTIKAEDDAIQLEGELVGAEWVPGKWVGGEWVDGELVGGEWVDGEWVGGDFIETKLSGDLVNTKDGKLKANDDAVDIQDAQIGGDIRNDGTIVAGDKGYEIDDLALAGNFVNTGSIDAQGDAVNVEDSTITGRVENTGRIDSAEGDGIAIGEESTIGKLINNGSIVAAEKAIALYEGSTAAGVTIAGVDNKLAVLDGKQFALFAQGYEPTFRGAQPAASFGGIALAGSTRIIGDIYAQADALTVTGGDNRISGALDVKQLLVESGGELVLDSLASSSTAWKGAHPDADPDELAALPTLADALKTSDGTHNHGRLVLAKADSYQIIGDYHQTSDATLAVRATGDTTYSQLKIEGMAALDSGAKIAVDVRQDGEIAAGATSSNTLFNTNRLAGVIQAGTLESDGTFTVSDNSALFDFSGEKVGNNVDLVLKRAGSGGGSTGGDKKPVYLEQIVKDNKGLVPLASADAARVLDKITDRLVASGNAGAMAPVIDALGKLGTQTELVQAVEQLTPALPSAALSAVSDSLGAINRVVQARVEGNIGLSSGDELSAERYVWVKPFGSYAKQDARSETAGFKANTGGLVFGADAALSPKLRLGAALAYAHSDVDGKSASAPQSSKVDVYQLIGYGSVQLDGNTELNFQLDGGRNRNQGERRLSFMGLTANSDYDSLSYHAGAGIGRTFSLPRAISNTPSLRIDYTRIKEDGYSETGAGAAGLINGKRSVEQTLLAVDNRVTLPLNARQSVALNAGAAYDLMDDGATLTSAFAGEPGALFSTQAAGQSRWLWRAGLGYTYKADTGKGGLELSTRLDGEWRKGGYSNATASVKARYAF